MGSREPKGEAEADLSTGRCRSRIRDRGLRERAGRLDGAWAGSCFNLLPGPWYQGCDADHV